METITQIIAAELLSLIHICFNFGGRHATIEEVSACKHHFEVPSSDLTEVYVDGFMSGLGSNSCGPRPLPEYILDGNKEYSFTVTLRGISKRR